MNKSEVLKVCTYGIMFVGSIAQLLGHTELGAAMLASAGLCGAGVHSTGR